MQDVPCRMEEPTQSDEAIRIQTLVRAHCYQRGEDEFPDAETAAQISRARAGDHNRHEVPSVRLLEARRREDEEHRDNDWRSDILEKELGCRGHRDKSVSHVRRVQRFTRVVLTPGVVRKTR